MSDPCPICTEPQDGPHTFKCCKNEICTPCLLKLNKHECPYCRAKFDFDDGSWGDKAVFMKEKVVETEFNPLRSLLHLLEQRPRRSPIINYETLVNSSRSEDEIVNLLIQSIRRL